MDNLSGQYKKYCRTLERTVESAINLKNDRNISLIWLRKEKPQSNIFTFCGRVHNIK